MTRIFTILLCATFFTSWVKAQQIEDLHHISSYVNGVVESAEVVAYDADNKQVYFTSSSENSFSALDVSDLANPALLFTVDLSPYGAGPNSIDYSHGLIAVAVESDPKTDNGKVVFFNTDGTYLRDVTAGALPDMLTFNSDGTKVIVANEGEPNDDYSVDPEGSISVIDLSGGVASATVSHITFESFNDKKVSLMNKGVRIFGNNGTATVAQDLEPEYITLTSDETMAYVNCQEANALVLVDLVNMEVVDILPLGYKNHMLGTTSIELLPINEMVPGWPALGTPVYDGGQPEVMLGGFSGMFYAADSSSETESVFYVVPDRGPNDATFGKNDVTPAAPGNLRPFKLPDYQGRIVKFSINHVSGDIDLEQIMLTRQDGTTPITGKGNVPGYDEVPVTYSDASTPYANVDYIDNTSGEEFHELPYDEFGGDFEGILIDKNGYFWLCDEYRPAVYQFDASGKMIHRYVSEGTSLLGTTPMPEGTYGEETLPAVYSKRRANRGFEAIAYDSAEHVVYAFIQSPIETPDNGVRNNSDVIRILGIDANDGTPVSEYVYLLERNKYSGYSTSRVDKIGDAVYKGNGKFLVIERDSEGPDAFEGKKYIFEISLKGATNVLGMSLSRGELEEHSADELMAEGIQAVHKTKVLNLPSVGYVSSDKAEGIAILPGNRIAVMNDNDFGLAGAGITDKSVLGIISFDDNYGFDASNRDNQINITAHPTLGMLHPDAIASYEVNGMTYIVTANEGDSRDYDGYSEEVRVKDLMLDTIAYPDYATFQMDENLGRLKTTTANGDYDGDGYTDQIYSYGGRSFSIFDQYGNLVFDSGNDFEMISIQEEANLFNEDEGEKDGRSDDKGPEPEAVTIGMIEGNTYAFIGCERNSAILVYDVSNPMEPEFLTYYTNRSYNPDLGDVAPEIIKFVPAAESPNDENLLIVGYEVSGSVGFIQVDGEVITAISEKVRNAEFRIYPNPVAVDFIKLNKKLSGKIYNAMGVEIKTFTNVDLISVSDLSEGVYIISTRNAGSKRFLKR